MVTKTKKPMRADSNHKPHIATSATTHKPHVPTDHSAPKTASASTTGSHSPAASSHGSHAAASSSSSTAAKPAHTASTATKTAAKKSSVTPLRAKAKTTKAKKKTAKAKTTTRAKKATTARYTPKAAPRGAAAFATKAKSNSENVVRLSANTARTMLDTGTREAHKMQNKASEFTRAGAQQMSMHSGKASRAMNEMSAIAQSQMEAAMECGNIAASMTKEMSEEMISYTNEMFSNNVEISRDVFSCRTVSDLFDLQNKIIKSNLDGFFTQSTKFSEMMFNYLNQASEPLNGAMQNATKRLNRAVAA